MVYTGLWSWPVAHDEQAIRAFLATHDIPWHPAWRCLARRSCPSNTSAGSAVTPDFRGTWSLWTMRRPRRQDLVIRLMLPLEIMRLGGWAIRSQYGIDHMNSPENWEVTGGFLQCKNHSLGVITKARALVSWQRVWVKTRQSQNLSVFFVHRADNFCACFQWLGLYYWWSTGVHTYMMDIRYPWLSGGWAPDRPQKMGGPDVQPWSTGSMIYLWWSNRCW